MYPQKKERVEYLRKLKLSYKDTIEMLEYDEKIRPFQLLGLTINMQLLVSIAVGAGSVIGAASYALLNQKLEEVNPQIA